MEGDAEITATGAGRTAYTPLIRLSSGGMGYVELCVRREGRFERLYAVKRLLPTVRHDEDAMSMFIEEGRVGGLVQHPNVVGVLDVGADDRGPYLVMEYVSGVTVRELIAAAARQARRLPVQLVCRVAAQAARGLAAAHDLRSHGGEALALVHRDVSPHNLLVGYDGVVQVADFGIARVLGREHRTATGLLKGKLGYMSPEVLRFEELTPASDLFSFGVVLFEMLASVRLYPPGNDAKRARAILDDPPPPLTTYRDDVPEELAGLVERLLEKAPEDRPASARDVADTLERVANELARGEGKFDLVGYVRAAFAEELRDREAELQVALDELAAAPEEEEQSADGGARRWRYPIWAAGIGALAGAAALGGWAAGAVPMAEPATRSPPESLATVEADAGPPPEARSGPLAESSAETILIRLRSEPEGATVRVEGMDDVTTPGDIRLPRGEEEVSIRFSLEGHGSVEERVVPEMDQLLRVQLSPAPAARRPPRRRGRSAPPPAPPAPERSFELFGD